MLCEVRPGHKPVAGKWVLKIKLGAQGEIELIKARYAAKGFTQVNGVDFFETCSSREISYLSYAVVSLCY